MCRAQWIIPDASYTWRAFIGGLKKFITKEKKETPAPGKQRAAKCSNILYFYLSLLQNVFWLEKSGLEGTQGADQNRHSSSDMTQTGTWGGTVQGRVELKVEPSSKWRQASRWWSISRPTSRLLEMVKQKVTWIELEAARESQASNGSRWS